MYKKRQASERTKELQTNINTGLWTLQAGLRHRKPGLFSEC